MATLPPRPKRHPSGPTRETSRRAFRMDPILAALLLLSLALRLWGIGDRLPDPRLAADPMNDTVVDEGDRRVTLYAWEMWHGGVGPVDLDPKTGDWPGLPFYNELGVQIAYRVGYSIGHPGTGAAAFARHVQDHPAGIFLLGRVVNVLVGVATVLLVALIGRRLGGRLTGLLAALFLAVLPAHILISQRVMDPNLQALLFICGATLALFRFVDTGTAADSLRAGFLIGLAAACKYVPMALVLVLAFAGLGRTGRGQRRGAGGPAWRAIAAGLFAAVFSFASNSPFTLLDWGAKSQDVALQRSRLLSGWVGQSDNVIALPVYLIRTLPAMMTWPLYLAALVGLVLLWRSGAKGRVVALVAVVLLAANGFLGVAQERFILPALGSLTVAAAYAIARLAEWGAPARARSSPTARIARVAPIAVAIAVAMAGCAAQLVPVRRALAREDSRYAARKWIDASIPPAEMMAVDLYGPMVPAGPGERLAVVWPFLATQAERVRPAFHPEWLDGFRYYVTSSEVSRRFETAPERYPLENSFYAWIRARGTRMWSPDARTIAGPSVEVWKLPDSISTRETRDRIWDADTRGRQFGSRLARWCGEVAQRFVWSGEFARGEEWAKRSLSLNQIAGRELAYEALVFSQLQQGGSQEAEVSAREALGEFPRSELLHIYRAMALSNLGDRTGAIIEYRAALPLSSSEDSRRYVQAAIDQLAGH